jgi:hypothetical protein
MEPGRFRNPALAFPFHLEQDFISHEIECIGTGCELFDLVQLGLLRPVETRSQQFP